jgi:AraC family transcriptional regulator
MPRHLSPLASPTLGRVLQAAEIAGLWIGEVEYPASGTFSRHAHAHGYVTLVLRGGFEEHLGQRCRKVASGCVVVMPAEMEHSERFGPAGGRSLVVSLPAVTRVTPAAAAVFCAGPVTRSAIALCRAFRGSAGQAGLAIEEHLTELLAATGTEDEPERDGRLADRARERLAAHACGDLRLGALATELGCDPAHLARAFRLRHGCTMSRWLRRRRVAAAAQLLSDTRNEVARIAVDCGFADQSHLTRVFKAETGVTPGEFRRLASH